MDTPTAVRLSRQAHALDLLQTQLQSLQAENNALRAALTAREAQLTALTIPQPCITSSTPSP